jgi:hypothetical protein
VYTTSDAPLFVDMAADEDSWTLFQGVTPDLARAPGKAAESRIQNAPGGVMGDENPATIFGGGCQRAIEQMALKAASLSIHRDEALGVVRCLVQAGRSTFPERT